MICCKIGKECGKGGEGVDIQEVRGDLAERFPLWSERIRLLRFQSSDAVTLTDNDGAVIYYNDGAMTRRSRESRCFYMARQLLHLQLAHHARRGDRDLLVWKRACDAWFPLQPLQKFSALRNGVLSSSRKHWNHTFSNHRFYSK